MDTTSQITDKHIRCLLATSRLGDADLARVLSQICDADLARVLSRLGDADVARVIPRLCDADLARVLSRLGDADLARVIPRLCDADLARVIPRLGRADLARVIPRLGRADLARVLPRLGRADLARVIPRLCDADLARVIPRLCVGPIPIVGNLYSRMFADIQAKHRALDQRSFGSVCGPSAETLCNSPMCIAGHTVNMAGGEGYTLERKVGFALAATLIHQVSRPDVSPPRYDDYPDDWALAYIEERAAEEVKAR
jgi:hypothetical protein